MNLAHLDRAMYILGYIDTDNRVFLSDKDLNIVSYELLLAMLSYQTFVVRKEFDHANTILPQIPKSHHNKIAKFLEAQGFKKIALKVATDPELKFDLALELKKLDVAYKILKEGMTASGVCAMSPTDLSHKWKQLGDLALSTSQLGLALECATSARDLSGLLLLATCTGDVDRLKVVAAQAASEGRTNVSFLASFLLGDIEGCLDLLCKAGRVPEAAFLARTYLPSQVSRIVELWRKDLSAVSKRAAESLADPTEYSSLFPQFELAMKAEQLFKQRRAKGYLAASKFPESRHTIDLNVIEALKELGVEELAKIGTVDAAADLASEAAAELSESAAEPSDVAAAAAPEPTPAPVPAPPAPPAPATAVAPTPALPPAPKPAAAPVVDDDDDAFLADLQDEIEDSPAGATDGDADQDFDADDLADFDIDNL